MQETKNMLDFEKARENNGTQRHIRVRPISASQQIYDALRTRIVSLKLIPGENLSRAEIAEYYGVSQTPVRDAMMKLEEDGLLVVFPQSKTEVSRIDIRQAQETQFLRLAVELEVAHKLSRMDDKRPLVPVRKILEEQQTALKNDNLERLATLDRSFHYALCEAAGVANLWQLVSARSGHIDRLRNLNLPDPGKGANILLFHGRILSALESGHANEAEEAVRGHLSGTLSQLDRIIARYPDYF
jgi:GntR family transcriptional regulator, rspAB operon transcriptional repressor